MQRRQFLAASLATSALAMVREAQAQNPAATGSREFYQIRKYRLENGAQTGLTAHYFESALIPALGRMGFGPIGAFSLNLGPETPTNFLLIPSASAEALVTVDLHLAEDAEFQKAAESFWTAPASSPSFQRVESTLLIAFEGYPKLTPPPGAATKAKRIFQMRTYESPSFDAKFGAVHGTDVSASFNNYRDGIGGTGSRQQRALWATFAATWVAFARTGNPNHPKIPNWAPYEAAKRATMIFDNNTRVENDPRGEIRAFWERMPLPATPMG